jgi:amino acid adenylation domain-containing protein
MSSKFKVFSQLIPQKLTSDLWLEDSVNSSIKFSQEDTEQSITQRFEEQVRRYPQAIAVQTGITRITYTQLNAQANRLACTIISRQEQGKELVALLLDQGLDFITGIFGVLKTGKFYVPMDPSIPVNRLNSIIEDSKVSLIITNNRNLFLAREIAPPECLILNLDEIDTSLSAVNLDLSISPDTPAYLIYTSGSTGKPKGVLQNHRNTLHNCMNNTHALSITSQDRLTLLHSCGVMGAMRGICNALLNGATLYPLNVKEEGLTSLVQLLIEEKITIYHSVTTLFRHFVGSLTGTEEFPRLRVLIIGGEQVLQRDIELYKQHFADECKVFVSLGSTETGTVRQYMVNKKTLIQSSAVPIGYSVKGMEVLLLDESGAEVEPGRIGEIAVKSEYLALGYWENLELTSEKFSIVTDDNQRIYRTGDLGRFESDGCLIHMGRKDFQVKIRGFRIEIAEIELALLNTGKVKEVVVIACDDVRGDKSLVAYVVPQPNLIVTAKELRLEIQHHLPSYMLPSVFIFLDALPLTPNSKIDRTALPTPDFAKSTPVTELVTPRSTIEQKLVEIWEEVLEIHPISIKDSFFDLGGYSLLSIQLFAKIEKQFGEKLPLSTLLHSETIEKLAVVLSQIEQSKLSEDVNNNTFLDSWSSVVQIQPNGNQLPLFFMHPLGGEVMCYRKLAIQLGSERPFYALQPKGLDGKESPYTRIEDMAARYIMDIQNVQPQGPYLIGGFSFGGIIALEVAQQLRKQGEEVACLIMLDTCRPGYNWRLPLMKRIPIHIKKLLRQPSSYVQQKVKGMAIWSKYHLRETYKPYTKIAHHFAQIAMSLPENDEHLHIIQANAIALNEYIFSSYPGKLTLLRTADEERDDDKVGMEYEPDFGWTELFTGGLEIHHIPGSHISLLDEPHISVVAEKIKTCLNQVSIS